MCTACTSPCLTCSGSITSCVTCISGDYLYGTTCVSTCPSTTVAVSTASPPQCEDCGPNCKTCTSANVDVCLTCATGYFLYSSTCINTCPTGTYQSGTNCYSCDTTCLTCSGPNNNECTSCNTASATNGVLLNNYCVASCPSGYTTVSGVCTACTSPCLTCTVAATQCVTCIAGDYLYNAKCYSSCPSTTVA